MHTIDKNIDKAKIIDVARAFWNAMQPWRWGFYLSITCAIIVGVFQVCIPLLYKRFFDLLSAAGSRASIASDLVKVILLVLLFNIIIWSVFRIGIFIVNYFESSVMARLKQMSFDYLINHSHSFFANTFTGSLVQRINRFARAFERLYDTFIFNFLSLLVNTVGAIIVVFYQEKIVAYIIVVWVIVVVLSNYFFSRWKVKYDIKSAAADSATTALLADTISNQNAVSSFVGSDYESMSFKEISNKQAKATRLTWNLSTAIDGLQGALFVAIEFFIFYYAIKFWEQGLLTIGTFVLIQAYIIGLANRLWNLGRLIRDIYEGYADSEEMVRILNLPHEIKDMARAKDLIVKRGKIEMKNVSFKFANKKSVLNNVSLSIKGGEKIALVGPSGAGKSTLIKLILRLYNTKNGQVLIDNQDIQKVTQASLRHAISAVPQDPVLFHRSLLENIRYGNRQVTDEEVIKAAQLAHCDDFIEQLPLKYETLVGERGIKLSGGERQRIAIARAILKNAPILILDEATSSLDSHSELLIQDALNVLMKGKTVIVIAHRLSTIRKMDRIIVLDKGKITEEGTHEDLLAKDKSLYKHLWELQAGGFLRM